MSNSILAALAGYFGGCPLLAGHRLNVGYLPDNVKQNGVEYSLDAVGDGTAGRQYLGDDSPATRQFLFAVRSVGGYGPDPGRNLEGLVVYTQLARWLDSQSRAGQLPVLPAGLQAVRIEALDSGILMENTGNTAKYRMQCALTYLQY